MTQSPKLADRTTRGEASATDGKAEEKDDEGDEEEDDVAALNDWKQIKEDITTLSLSDEEVDSDEELKSGDDVSPGEELDSDESM
ncbi:hypothetical protein FRC12_002916 [Ceratobasidium sp. 428]|nr:hypothetical protein FRC12_002916 [Ceratobasidium sp. 428]